MRQSLTQVRPEAGPGGMSPARTGGVSPPRTEGITPRDPGAIPIGTRSPASYGERTMGVSTWRRGAPQASFGRRIASWRARNWRRAVLAWFVLTLTIMAVAAEPAADFPKAQAGSVPAVRVALRVAGIVTVAGVPGLLIMLP
jgi:hypothetical protein